MEFHSWSGKSHGISQKCEACNHKYLEINANQTCTLYYQSLGLQLIGRDKSFHWVKKSWNFPSWVMECHGKVREFEYVVSV